jgi:SAM-dependent methyltransferase
MSGFAVIGGALGALSLLRGLRIRGRAAALAVVQSSKQPVAPDHVFLVRPGVKLDDACRRAASAHARAHGLQVLDLVAPGLDAWRAGRLLDAVDAPRYRADRVAQGQTAGDAILVTTDVLERSRVGRAPSSGLALIDAIRRLKRCAVTETDVVLVPGLESRALGLRERRRIVRFFGAQNLAFVAARSTLLALVIAFAPRWGFGALALSHLELLLGTLGTSLRPRDRFVYALLRTPVDLVSTFGPPSPPLPPRETEAELRATYAAMMARGTGEFFEPRRDDCPLCRERALEDVMTTGDLIQHKPGRFVLSKCTACGHIFQNPRLSLTGLSFYYRDCYDGLGEEHFEELFSLNPNEYRQRAQMVAAVAASPKRWLDVGAGHGHFCCVAQDVLPNTSFDGLDFTESIEDAERRRWVERGIRGLFVDHAAQLASLSARYDVVSMSHYLEHALDPRAELEAAALVLPEGGHLLIEVPDPDCRLAFLLGRFWASWTQPQHLHFLNVSNLEKLLRAGSFEPVVWHRGEARLPRDFMLAVCMVVGHVAPPLGLPWRRRSGIFDRAWHDAVWTLALPFVVVAYLLDQVAMPLLRRPGWSNTYRVLARRVRTQTSRETQRADREPGLAEPDALAGFASSAGWRRVH